jgi:type II secretory pathway pseudopilin PulG
MLKKINTKKAFSLLEVMLSIFLLTVGMITLLTLVAKSIKVSIESRNKIIATMLAQEGHELIINARDTRLLNEENDDMVNLFNNSSNSIDLNITTRRGVGRLDYRNYMNYPIPSENNLNGLCFEKAEDKEVNCVYNIKYSDVDGYQYVDGSQTNFRRYSHFWYAGYTKVGSNIEFNSVNTCAGGTASVVCYGNPEICLRAEGPFVWEKDPMNPKCGVIDIGDPTINY